MSVMSLESRSWAPFILGGGGVLVGRLGHWGKAMAPAVPQPIGLQGHLAWLAGRGGKGPPDTHGDGLIGAHRDRRDPPVVPAGPTLQRLLAEPDNPRCGFT